MENSQRIEEIDKAIIFWVGREQQVYRALEVAKENLLKLRVERAKL